MFNQAEHNKRAYKAFKAKGLIPETSSKTGHIAVYLSDGPSSIGGFYRREYLNSLKKPENWARQGEIVRWVWHVDHVAKTVNMPINYLYETNWSFLKIKYGREVTTCK